MQHKQIQTLLPLRTTQKLGKIWVCYWLPLTPYLIPSWCLNGFQMLSKILNDIHIFPSHPQKNQIVLEEKYFCFPMKPTLHKNKCCLMLISFICESSLHTEVSVTAAGKNTRRSPEVQRTCKPAWLRVSGWRTEQTKPRVPLLFHSQQEFQFWNAGRMLCVCLDHITMAAQRCPVPNALRGSARNSGEGETELKESSGPDVTRELAAGPDPNLRPPAPVPRGWAAWSAFPSKPPSLPSAFSGPTLNFQQDGLNVLSQANEFRWFSSAKS